MALDDFQEAMERAKVNLLRAALAKIEGVAQMALDDNRDKIVPLRDIVTICDTALKESSRWIGRRS